MGFARAYWFSMTMFIYASLLTGGAEFLYFKTMDHGQLLNVFYTLVEDPATVDAYGKMGLGESLKTLKETVDQVAGLSPLEITLALFNQNIFFSLVMAIPTAFFAKKAN